MQNEHGFLIVGLTLALVILFNVVLILSLKSPATRRQIQMLHKAWGRFRNPWGKEEQNLAKLRESIAGLKSVEDETPNDGE